MNKNVKARVMTYLSLINFSFMREDENLGIFLKSIISNYLESFQANTCITLLSSQIYSSIQNIKNKNKKIVKKNINTILQYISISFQI